MTNARTDQPDAATDLSEAARAVVRDAGDPRIDAHLRALGLSLEADDPPAQSLPVEPAATPDPGELAGLRARVTELEAALASSVGRVRVLAGALVAALLGIVVLAVLLVAR